MIDLAERFLKTKEIDCYKIELWAKYSGAINYDQFHHRDYRNHTIVVPREDRRHAQMTTFILLSDVTAADGPTKVVPLSYTRDIPMGQGAHQIRRDSRQGSLGRGAGRQPDGLQDRRLPPRLELHRAGAFALRDPDGLQEPRPGAGRASSPGRDHSGEEGVGRGDARWHARQRDLFGWPPAGSDYWNEQTLRDVQTRYPEMDLSPYR